VDAILITKWFCATLSLEKYVHRSSAVFQLFPYTLPYVLSVPVFYPFILCWSLTTLRHTTSRTASHSAKRYTQVNLKHPQAHPLVSSDVPSASGNPSPSRNIQDSSKTHNDTTAKLKRNRTYPDKEGDGRTASSADRKRLGSKGLALNRTLERRSHLRRAVFILPVNLPLPMGRLEKAALLES